MRSKYLALCILVLFPSLALAQNRGTITKARPARPAEQVSAAIDHWHSLGRITSSQRSKNGIEIRSGQQAMRLTAISDDIVRVQVAFDGVFPVDNSFAVLQDAIAKLKPSASPRVVQSANYVELATANLRVRVRKQGLLVTFMDAAGNVLSQDDAQRPLLWKTSKISDSAQAVKASFTAPALLNNKTHTSFSVWKVMPEDEHYFGLGDKAGPLDHRNQSFTMWNTDAFGWQESTDPLYKTIPFFVALRNGVSYGIFLDNTYRSNFNFGKTDRAAYSFGSDDGALDYYFFYGPHPKQVIDHYTSITGRTPMPPLWTLGYQQCRYSYYPEARVREIANTFREKRIPVDAIYLDIDYQDGNRPFTVNRTYFPNFEGMIADLAKQGIKTIAITDMHLKKEPGYAPFDTGMKGDHFVKNPDGSVYVGVVWPGASVFPDFTRGKATREWWGSLYTDFVNKGIKGFWNDMNEPAVFERLDKTMPLDTVHRVAMPDGSVRVSDHREIHNVYGMENVHATYEGMLRLRPELRPFVLTRAAYAGAQRFAATWTGDNSSSWNHMRLSLPTLLNMGVSGYSNVGDDIGGFWGSPPPELFTRWMELGAFNPVFRNHAEKHSADKEPWTQGPEHEAIRKKYIELRYRLMPYTYTAFEENTRTGTPVMRAMFLEYPQERPDVITASGQFMFGHDILVAPKVWEFLSQYDVALPAGEWYDYWTAKPIEGGKSVQVSAPLDTLPLFVRAGAIIPQQPVVQSLDEKPNGPLELRVYTPDSEKTACEGSLYSDDGLTYQFKKGAFLRMQFTCSYSAGLLTVASTHQGEFQPWWAEVHFQIAGAVKAPYSITFGNERVNGVYDATQQILSFTLPGQALQAGVRVQY